MRSNQELMNGIRRKKALIVAGRQQRRLAAVGAVLAASLAAAMFAVPGHAVSTEQHTATVMGSTILGSAAGGYVIVALLAFALGIVVTVLIQKQRSIRKTVDGGQAQDPETKQE